MAANHHTDWNDQKIGIMSALWQAGETITLIAQHFGVSRSTISGVIMRNRDMFELRVDENGKPLTKRPKSSGGVNKARNPKWSEAQFELAIRLWDEGKSLRAIGAEMGLSASTVSFVTANNKTKFRPRQRTRLPPQPKAKEPTREFIEYDKQASEKYDFTQYQIADTAPVSFWQLSGFQCHFPLERFEDKSGPETPCCGQKAIDGESYCNTHWRLMRSPA